MRKKYNELYKNMNIFYVGVTILFIIVGIYLTRKYYFNNKETRNELDCFIESSNIWCSSYNFEGKPEGVIIDKSIYPKFIIRNTYQSDDDPFIFCKKNIFEKINKINDSQKFKKIDVKEIQEKEKLNLLTRKKNIDENSYDSSSESEDDDENTNIKYLVKTTSEYCGYNRYSCRNIKIPNDHIFNEKQDELFMEVMQFYNENKFVIKSILKRLPSLLLCEIDYIKILI